MIVCSHRMIQFPRNMEDTRLAINPTKFLCTSVQEKIANPVSSWVDLCMLCTQGLRYHDLSGRLQCCMVVVQNKQNNFIY